jgi:membrane protein required for colicin V production
MEGLGITWFDLAGAGIVAFSALMAFARGLIREIFSIVAFFGAFAAAVLFAERGRPFVERFTPLDDFLAALGAGLAIFLVVFFVIMIITSVVAKSAHSSTEIGAFDRAAGLAFGALRGVLIVALVVLLLRQATGAPAIASQATIPAAIAEARTYPIYDGVAATIERLFPQVRERAGDILSKTKGSESAPAP